MSLGYDGLTGMEVQIPGISGGGLGGAGGGGRTTGGQGAGGGFPNAFENSVAPPPPADAGNNNHNLLAAASARRRQMGAAGGGVGGGGLDDGALITDTETVDDGSRSNFTGMTAAAGNGNGNGGRKTKQQAKVKSNSGAAKTTTAAKGTTAKDVGKTAATGPDGTAITATAQKDDPATSNPTNPTADLEESIRAEAEEQYRWAVSEFEAHLDTVRRATDQALDGLKHFLDAAVETQIAYVRAQHSTDVEAARIAQMEPEVQAATAAMMGAGGGGVPGGGGGGTGGGAAAIAAMMMGGMLGGSGGGGGMGSTFGGGAFN